MLTPSEAGVSTCDAFVLSTVGAPDATPDGGESPAFFPFTRPGDVMENIGFLLVYILYKWYNIWYNIGILWVYILYTLW